jgi:hypothetical protein
LANAAIQEITVVKITSAAMRFMETSLEVIRIGCADCAGKQNLCGSKYLLGLGKVKSKNEHRRGFRRVSIESCEFLRKSGRKMRGSCIVLHFARRLWKRCSNFAPSCFVYNGVNV